MPVYLLDDNIIFPPITHAEPDGLLAIGGDLSLARLKLAYESGIFPWYSEDTPIMWFAPNPRMVLRVEALQINRSLRKAIRKQPYTLTLDTAFRDVVEACASTPRPGQDGTWITEDMLDAYEQLHQFGLAHSIEAWHDGTLVGGAYGVCLGGIFCGESMFAHAPNASKIAFATLVRQLEKWDIRLIDCQVYTEHIERFGATEWPRRRFMYALRYALRQPTRMGPWEIEQDLLEHVAATGGAPISMGEDEQTGG
jgi:leucyl/phenylalanyl-tRNA--protein transferase